MFFVQQKFVSCTKYSSICGLLCLMILLITWNWQLKMGLLPPADKDIFKLKMQFLNQHLIYS